MLRDRDFSIFMTLLWPWPWSDVPQNWIISRYYPRVHVYEFSAKSNHNCRCRSAITQTDRQTDKRTLLTNILVKKKKFFFLPSNKQTNETNAILAKILFSQVTNQPTNILVESKIPTSNKQSPEVINILTKSKDFVSNKYTNKKNKPVGDMGGRYIIAY